ncbi:hypothetical protein [Pseudomonas cichorii]|uniref:hypothetical protein n=1 Tax=Pseudomonas cichorii TaxID=36746 RepID=UPI001910C963|nr:hypothetical protein [Pseudomonas cichorii]
MEDPTPKSMRFWEQAEEEKREQKAAGTYVPAPFEGVELHQKYDQERFRFAQLPFRSQFWLLMLAFGKGGFIVFLPISLFVHLLAVVDSRRSWWEETSDLLLSVYPVFLGIPLLLWLIGHIIVNYFPRIWFRPPKGPLWELNRRTGLVTLFDYKRFKKDGVIDERVAPFHEFDAYMTTTPDRHGPMHGLLLCHRYGDIQINLNSLFCPDDMTHKPCALWDYLQNFMDISRPLPDLPCHEPYRHLDPITAEHDRKYGRKQHYWMNMDDDTFKAKVNEMSYRIATIDTLIRPNLMARHVVYSD